MADAQDSAPLPALPASGQVDWFAPRNQFDAEVRRRLEGYLSPDQLDAAFVSASIVGTGRQSRIQFTQTGVLS